MCHLFGPGLQSSSILPLCSLSLFYQLEARCVGRSGLTIQIVTVPKEWHDNDSEGIRSQNNLKEWSFSENQGLNHRDLYERQTWTDFIFRPIEFFLEIIDSSLVLT